MDEILRSYLILMIYLLAAAFCDIFMLAIPMWATYFAFFGWLACAENAGPASLAKACAAALFIYFIAEILSLIKGFTVLGRGDVFIIFIIALFLDTGAFLAAMFLSCLFALVLIIIFCGFMKFSDIPLAPAFLFGAMAVIW